MARPKAQPKQAAVPESPPEPQIPFIKWPIHPEECPPKARTFRMHRLNSFEWQAYATEDGIEQPIGKPDLFEMVEFKLKHVMRVEGQRDFLAAKKAKADAQEKAHDEALKAAQDAKQV